MHELTRSCVHQSQNVVLCQVVQPRRLIVQPLLQLVTTDSVHLRPLPCRLPLLAVCLRTLTHRYDKTVGVLAASGDEQREHEAVASTG